MSPPLLYPITPEARLYALKELARRAGVARDFFQKWSVEVTPGQTTISFGSETKSRIHLRHASPDSLLGIKGGSIPVAHIKPFQSPDGHLVGDAHILPFCDNEGDQPLPLYQSNSDDTVVCNLDILASFLFTLSRLEESLCATRDEFGRFLASSSLASAGQFLERPILDEHGLAFEQVLARLLPSWKPQPRTLRLKLTHDIDDIGIPFQPRTSFGHTLKRGHPGATLRDLLAAMGAGEPAELAMVRKLAAISRSRNLHSAFYWKASPKGPKDSGYDPADSRVQRVIRFLQEGNFELGVHPGYDTFCSLEELKNEVDRLRRTLRVDSPGGRQHYLRWSPQTWLDWEACGLSYDSSLGFTERFGFRAGTAYPYRPWSLEENREINLIEVPLILMDCTPVKYMKMSRGAALNRIKAMIEKTTITGGVFTVLWHNTPFLDRDYDGWYEAVLNLLSNAKPYNMPASAELLW